MIKIDKFYNKNKFLSNKQIFVACSGGVDSMVLLHILSIGFKNLSVLHVNYRLREKESEEDELFVRSFCSKMKIPCMVYRITDEEQI